ncbi:BTB domain and ankyrin repeat protein [Ceratobasidium theobromae]|uniref:BTB domain and ankyrin repeat protein n=1 Tax=Ceratobasidium theobromae TaxID=1582974 RepID=A0A5N5QD68_9AGAM|nr:BTB domain and ankyrin repeat protein [Ceratobasidium theobromae]
MSNLHAYFHLRNLGAFRQLLDARGGSTNRSSDGRPGSGPRSWSQQTQAQMTTNNQGGQIDNNPNLRDSLGRTVLHLACADLAPIALEFVRALLALPTAQIDVNAQDTESGWTALHRTLYAGNLPAAVLLLARSDIDTGIRDLEGMTSFDVYNSTVEGTVPDTSSLSPSRELWVWGSNRNATLGIGSADDRVYPESIQLSRPVEVVERLTGSSRFSLIGVKHIAMSRLHTSILTNEPRGNLEACGFGGVGRLGTKQHTQYSFSKVSGLENQTIIGIALGLDHTLALTNTGDVLSWGLNRFHQLGYIIEPSEPPGKSPTKGKAPPDPSDNQVQTSPKRVLGPLRKERVVGVAACKTASVCWTSEDLYTWGTNSGQLGYAKTSPGWQVLPRKVATLSKVVDVAISDTAMVCLMPTKDIYCFWSGTHFRIQFSPTVFPHRYRTPQSLGRIQIAKITCNDTVFAALTTNGEVFLFTLPDNPGSESDSGPNVRPQKVWSLRRRVSAVHDIALGADGTIIVCTASGHVFVHAPKPVKGPSISSSASGSGISSGLLSASYRTHKYHPVPGLQRVVAVAANSTGGFAALRDDSGIEPLVIEGKSLSQEMGEVQPYLVALDSKPHPSNSILTAGDGDEDGDEDEGIADDAVLAERLCHIVARARETTGPPPALQHHHLHGADMRLSGVISVPVHRSVVVTRSSVLRNVIGGKPLSHEGLDLNYSNEDVTLSVSGCHALSVLVLLNYLYSDMVCPIWDQRIKSLILPSLLHIGAVPGAIQSDLQRLARALDLPALQNAVSTIQKRTPVPTLCVDFTRLFYSAQSTGNPILAHDICLELADRSVFSHSAVLRARSPFFASFFDEPEWTRKRWDENGVLTVDLKHLEWRPMEYVFRYMYGYGGTTTNLFDGVDFARSVEEFINFVFQVMSAANELMLEQLTQICSSVILRHVTLSNCTTILTEASPMHSPKLKARLHKYLAVNMETLLEKRYLDDMAFSALKDLATFVREQQAAKHPHARSGVWIAEIMEKHKGWLELQDFPRIVVRTAPPGRQPKTSPSLSPAAPASPKAPRRISSFNLQSTPRKSSAGKSSDRLHDGMFAMDEESTETPLAPESPDRSIQSNAPPPELATSYRPPTTPPARGWEGISATRVERVDMRAIMADEAAHSKPARSSMVRITGFDAAGQPVSPSKTPQRERVQQSARSQPTTPPASASTSWRDPPAPSGSPVQRSSEAKSRPREFPDLFRASAPQQAPFMPQHSAAPSPSSVPKPNTQQTSPIKPTKLPSTAAPAFPGLGPVIVPKRSTSGADGSSSRKRNNPDAWTAPPPMPSLPTASGSVSFSEIQQQQHAQKTGFGAKTHKKSLLEIQAEEAEQARLLQEEELARAREAEDLAAEIEFMRWWHAEEARVRKEMEGGKGSSGAGGRNRRKGRGGSGKRGKGGQGNRTNTGTVASPAMSSGNQN